jgi:hypothetical protein
MIIILQCRLCGKYIKVWFDWNNWKRERKLFHVIDKLYCDHCAHYWAHTEV